jgi:hypothetical protein
MATTLASNGKVYDPRTQVAYREKIAQQIELFNAASRGCIKLSTVTKPADFDFKAFWRRTSASVTRRDTTSVAAVTPQAINQDEFVGVKLNRKIGPYSATMDTFRKLGMGNGGESDMAMAIGEFVAEETAKEKVDTALLAISAALGVVNTGALKLDISALTGGAQYISGDVLNTAMFKRGDAYKDVVCWVTHSSAYQKLRSGQLTSTVTGVADILLDGGDALTLGRPVIVTDSPSLVSGANFITLGLTADAVEVEDTETEIILTDTILGNENIMTLMQGEYAYNMNLLGMAWDTAAGANPSSAAIGTGANWIKRVQSDKSLGGVYILSK